VGEIVKLNKVLLSHLGSLHSVDLSSVTLSEASAEVASHCVAQCVYLFGSHPTAQWLGLNPLFQRFVSPTL